METSVHANLKRLAAMHLLAYGCVAIGTEVRCPGSRYRVDAAGYLDHLPWPSDADSRGAATLWSTVQSAARARVDRRCEPRTIIIECKQSRSDFIRDDGRADELFRLRDEARRWKTHLEERRIKVHEPELRESGSALFADMETWDFAASRLTSYRKLLRRIRRIEAQIYGETKFCTMSRYRVADQLYLCIPRGLIRKRELPDGWGLIEFAKPVAQIAENAVCAHVAVEAPQLRSPAHFRARLLRNIAVAATRHAYCKPLDVVVQIGKQPAAATSIMCNGTTGASA